MHQISLLGREVTTAGMRQLWWYSNKLGVHYAVTRTSRRMAETSSGIMGVAHTMLTFQPVALSLPARWVPHKQSRVTCVIRRVTCVICCACHVL
jgi:hypothetical protein